MYYPLGTYERGEAITILFDTVVIRLDDDPLYPGREMSDMSKTQVKAAEKFTELLLTLRGLELYHKRECAYQMHNRLFHDLLMTFPRLHPEHRQQAMNFVHAVSCSQLADIEIGG